MMAGKTPHLDKLAKEGMRFTDYYAEASCTAGRANFITGELPIRTGLTTVGQAGAKVGLPAEACTMATALKSLGYATGQFGKNHLGDRNDMLPTNHGFDEWFGNLYHLNAEEEPENVDYPKNPAFRERFGPRGVLHCFATDKDDPTDDPRFGKMGKQKCEDTGALTRKRMETIDDEVTAGAIKFMDKAASSGKPFFVWWNSSRMHTYTHLSPKWEGKTGLGIEADGMVEHDTDVGLLLNELRKLGVEDNTIIMYSSDNGAEFFLWPDGGTTPFRGEKNTQWEGGYRVPCMIRWPGVIKPGTIINDIGAHEDMMPTLLAAAGDSTLKEDLLKGKKIGDMSYKVHLDGYNLIPFLKGEVKENPRPGVLYWSDEGDLMALRYDDWKIHFMEQRAEGILAWQEPFVPLRLPKLFNLRSDPFENADIAAQMFYSKWRADRLFMLLPAGALVQQWLKSLAEFPPRQRPEHWSVGNVLEMLEQKAQALKAASGGGVK